MLQPGKQIEFPVEATTRSGPIQHETKVVYDYAGPGEYKVGFTYHHVGRDGDPDVAETFHGTRKSDEVTLHVEWRLHYDPKIAIGRGWQTEPGPRPSLFCRPMP